MKWLLKRLSIVCLIMGILCAAAVVVGRLDHSPSKLQSYGLDLCDGEPCFRGIKAGSDVSVPEIMFPGSKMLGGIMLQVDNLDKEARLIFNLSSDGSRIDFFSALHWYSNDVLPYSAGEVIHQFGVPCQFAISDTYPARYVLYYQGIQFILTPQSPNILFDNSLQPESPVSSFTIYHGSDCNDPITTYSGPWHGFMSDESYIQRNLKEMARNQSAQTSP